ncbi:MULTISPECIES: CdaR family transcriptional regulator [Streptomyces]|uniref:PucR family transcriptional regulator n=1 Tax=Streptomyces TaxID=1883 RepID=UPI00103E4E85|nr:MULTISPECIES: helix-turn-helix domain-containing protein [Streptomyces]MBT3074441.1 helix-turn-helix domain-containing protein [Streptomyces sp. COG21]MBT3083036.1 helix-turn-helix domain-containing protein [Streptomyces sp. COG20]MBT3085908.1 helix-turn-helix domain-containing protein [Streptomyces sp. CYG21]MBT3096633.1 helix-turn-helix domain-containing protein [Streptomyces sp. CBG30]MBT3105230.1 helix-turn-helix domain-containing protein [Streptomyces sp. COG19]
MTAVKPPRDRAPTWPGYEALLDRAATTGQDPGGAELERLRAFGELAAADGTTLRGLVVRHLSRARAAWPAGTAEGDRVLVAVQLAVEALCEGYERAQQLAVRQQESARREFIDDLLYGRGDPVRLAERAERFGLRLSHEHAVAAAEGPTPYTEGDSVPRRVERAVTGRFGERRTLLTTKGGRMVCIAPGDQRQVLAYFAKQAHAATGGGRAAVGRPHPGAGGVVHSYEEALQALDLAGRLGLEDPVLHAADLLVYPVLTRDRRAMAELVRTTLGPLLKARGGPEPYLETLTAYFDAGCVTTQAARHLSLSVRALTYRLQRIHQLTGSDPTDPRHRYPLQTAVIGARILGWPERKVWTKT